MLELLYVLCRALVDEPDQIQITQSSDHECITYAVTVAPSDVGKVVGKNGHISNAVRIIVKSAAMKYKRKVYVNILGDTRQQTYDLHNALVQSRERTSISAQRAGSTTAVF